MSDIALVRAVALFFMFNGCISDIYVFFALGIIIRAANLESSNLNTNIPFGHPNY